MNEKIKEKFFTIRTGRSAAKGTRMDVRIEATAGDVAQLAADFVEKALESPSPTIGLATGGTPLATYAELIDRHRTRQLRFDHAHYVMLDEYVGVAPDDPVSYHHFIREQFTDQVGVAPTSVHGPLGDTEHLDSAADAYEEVLATLAPREVQILGIGRDGHIGFNEPTSSLASRTRVKTLHSETRADNQRFFPAGQPVPRHALTMGIGTILEAKRLLLIATGEAKAEAIAAAIEGPVTAMVPATALQLHRAATVVIDEAAAAQLVQRDYYIEVASHRPEWQRP